MFLVHVNAPSGAGVTGVPEERQLLPEDGWFQLSPCHQGLDLVSMNRY